MSNNRAVVVVRRGAVVLLLLLASRASRADEATGARVWVSARAPIGLHLGSPDTALESGMRADLLVMSSWPPTASRGQGEGGRYRTGVGPLLELRTLGVSNFGVGAGVMLAAFTPGTIPLGIAIDGQVSKWVTSSSAGGVSVGGALSFQVRTAGAKRGVEWTSITALYVRAARSVSTDSRELTIGLDLGSAAASALVAMQFGTHD